MSETEKALQLLPAKSISRILYVLLSARQKLKQGENATVPYARFFLGSGQTIGGWLLDIQEDHGCHWLLIHTSESMRTITSDVSYVAMNEIKAITLHYVESLMPSLSFGTIVMPIDAEIPSRLQLRQKLQELHDRFAGIEFTIEWDSFGDRDEQRYHIGTMLGVLEAALASIISTDLGRGALADSTSSIRLRYANTLRVERADRHLDIYFACAPTASELERAIARLI